MSDDSGSDSSNDSSNDTSSGDSGRDALAANKTGMLKANAIKPPTALKNPATARPNVARMLA